MNAKQNALRIVRFDNPERVVSGCPTHSQYASGGNGGSGFSGHPALLVPQPASGIEHAAYRDGQVTVRVDGREWTVAHNLLET